MAQLQWDSAVFDGLRNVPAFLATLNGEGRWCRLRAFGQQNWNAAVGVVRIAFPLECERLKRAQVDQR